MNGYSSVDLLGRTGKNLSVTVNGQHMVFRGQPATPCTLTLNGAEGVPSALVYAGDSIEFIPAVQGAPAQRTLKDLLGADFVGGVMINGRMADLDTRLNTGDQIVTSDQPLRPAQPPPAPPRAAEPARRLSSPPPPKRPAPPAVERPEPPASRPNPWERRPEPPRPAPAPERTEPPKPEPPRPEPPRPVEPPKPQGRGVQVILNGKALSLPGKGDGSPYYVMDLLEFSGIDFEHLDRGVELQVNGSECAFTQELRPQDDVIIRYLER